MREAFASSIIKNIIFAQNILKSFQVVRIQLHPLTVRAYHQLEVGMVTLTEVVYGLQAIALWFLNESRLYNRVRNISVQFCPLAALPVAFTLCLDGVFLVKYGIICP